jgi:hypothetical protein
MVVVVEEAAAVAMVVVVVEEAAAVAMVVVVVAVAAVAMVVVVVEAAAVAMGEMEEVAMAVVLPMAEGGPHQMGCWLREGLSGKAGGDEGKASSVHWAY